jgi:Holliday junction resolvasome RuvABC endonuclease subunit
LISLVTIGIDPGNKGAIALVEWSGDPKNERGVIEYSLKERFSDRIEDNLAIISKFLCMHTGVAKIVAIETQRIIFGQAGAMKNASNYGQILGAVSVLAGPKRIEKVTPAMWQRAVHGHSTSLKRETIEWAKQMFYYDKLSDGEADALGIAYWAAKKK